MATTWATFLAEIRAELKDTSTTKRWSDETLYLYTKDAIRDYSQYFPRRVDRAPLTRTNGSYPLPSDFVEDVEVECPLDTFLERRLERPGMRYPLKSRPTMYHIEGGNLYLNGTPLGEDEVYLSYDACHRVPASASDSDFTLTVPETDEELIRLYVKAKATGQFRTQQAALDRFKVGSGDRQDNPLEPETYNLMNEYLSKIALRFRGGVVRLYRPGRGR